MLHKFVRCTKTLLVLNAELSLCNGQISIVFVQYFKFSHL